MARRGLLARCLAPERVDTFAFGVVLREMLTGCRMFEGETLSHLLAAVLAKEPETSRRSWS